MWLAYVYMHVRTNMYIYIDESMYVSFQAGVVRVVSIHIYIYVYICKCVRNCT